MAAKPMKTVDPDTLDDWRRWLADHHASEAEVWLIFHKRHTGRPSIDYEDAVDEALCFGWVDSLIKRIDDERYARKFTPRRADSVWSASNRTRYAALKASGRLTAAGEERAPTGRHPDRPPTLPLRVPSYIQAALENHPAALRRFDSLPPSHRRNYVFWIDSAKRDETRARRLKEAIGRLSAGKPLGMM